MRQVIIDKISSDKIDKSIKILLFCLIGSSIILLVKIRYIAPQHNQLGFLIDAILVVYTIYSSLQIIKKLKNRKGQFIQWQKDSIVYKLKEEIIPKEIFLGDIKNIEIKLDIITIESIDQQKFILDISDFDKYESRIRIKSNFEKLNLYLNLHPHLQ